MCLRVILTYTYCVLNLVPLSPFTMPPSQSSASGRAHQVRQTMVQLTIGGSRIPEPRADPLEALEVEQVTHQQAGMSSGGGSSSSTSAMPPLAEIERARAAKRKAPEGPRGRSKCGRSTKETKVAAVKRLSEFDGQGLTRPHNVSR